ncbi:hypothetical protein Tsubulata_020406 [Turnera subulata]|uniref:Uncharacterized protein n=1 Tax=Turnera subulata TaxID=218843 RepID=A0A9Q0J7N1_9ROSI|nr:hypothetical protein Tsubulata_020406 [Turnera subulata]
MSLPPPPPPPPDMDPDTQEQLRRIESAASVSVPSLVRQFKRIADEEKSIQDTGFDAIKFLVEGSILPMVNNLIYSYIFRGHWLAVLAMQGIFIFSLVVPFWWAHFKLKRMILYARLQEANRINTIDGVKILSEELDGMLATINVTRASLPDTGIKIYLDTLDQLRKSLSASSDLTKSANSYMKMLLLPFVQACIVIAMCLYLFC